jgi:hypothetical protein
MDSITQDVSWKRKLRRIYDFNLSSRMWSDGGFVTFRAMCWGNCSRMLWTEHPVCHVCVATDRQNTPIIRMSAKIDYQLRQRFRVFLFAWKNWATIERNFVKFNIYIYKDISKDCRKFYRDWIMRSKPAVFMKMYSRYSYGNIWLNCYRKKLSLRINLYRNSKHILYSVNTPQNSVIR